jgi:hypothetical protein
MRHLARADPEGERAERAMGRGVAVAADHRHAGKGQPLLGRRDMHDALFGIGQLEGSDSVGAGVALEGLDDAADLGIGDLGVPARDRRRVMVAEAEGEVAPAHRQPARLQHVKAWKLPSWK